MKVYVEIWFDNCQDYHGNIQLKGVSLPELKLHAKELFAYLEGFQNTIDDMVRNSVEDKTQ